MQAVSTLTPTPARRRLLWLVLANVAVAAVLALLVHTLLDGSRRLHQQRALDAVDSLAQSVAQNVAAELALVDLALRQLRLVAEDGDPARTQATARDVVRGVPSAERLRAVPVEALEADVRDALRAAATDRLVIVGPREDADGRWHVRLARSPRAAGPPGAPAVVADFDVARFEALFAGLDLGGRSAVSLRTDDLALVARHTDPPHPRSGLGQRSTSAELLEALARAPEAGTYLAVVPMDGIERANAYRRVPGTSLRVIVGLATVDTLTTWRREAGTAVTITLMAIALVATASLMVARAWRRDDLQRQQVQAEQARWRALLVTISDGVHVLDRTGRLVEFSDAFATMLGLSRQALEGSQVMRWERRWSAGQVDHVLRSFAVGQHLRFDSIFERADGARIEVAVVANGVRIGGRDLLILSARDVTQAQRTRRQLEASQALLERTGRIARIGGWELDPASGRMALTAQARALLDLPADGPLTLRQCLRRVAGPRRREVLQALAATARQGRPWEVELPATSARGRLLWLHCWAERVDGADGRPRVAGAIRDVTERHERSERLQAEQALRLELQRQAEVQASMLQERDAMLDVLAHEVRQPLNNASAAMQSAMSSLAAVGEGPVAPRLLRAQAVLGQVMARLDNTLAVASLLARQGPVQRDDTDLDTLLALVIADMPAADRTRVAIQRETAARTVSLDMGLMRLALRNLLSNALKYSPPGSTVTVRLADSDDPLGLVIDVVDQGSGIEPGLRDHVFERGARGRHTPGAEHGLGLYIVRRVMELHGGQASVARTGAEGTTMRLIVTEPADD